MVVPPLVILAVGIATVLLLIVWFRLNAFLALTTAAILVSLLAPGEIGLKIRRVAEAFGSSAGGIGIIIAMAAIIGTCLIESGAADRIVRSLVRLLGEKRCASSLMTSGFVLSVPVFFDTVFYLLLPLARSMHRRTGKPFLLLVLSLGAGASITHSLVPPTPGPLLIVDNLKIDIGMMIFVGAMLAACTAVVTLFFIKLLTRWIDVPMRPIEGMQETGEPLPDERLPGLLVSLLPIVLPVLMISGKTVVETIDKTSSGRQWFADMARSTGVDLLQWGKLLGDPNLAMLTAAAVALAVFWAQRKPSLRGMAKTIETALMSGGLIILITAAGGAFGAMLKTADIGPAIQALAAEQPAAIGAFEDEIRVARGQAADIAKSLGRAADNPGRIAYEPDKVAVDVAAAAQTAEELASRARELAAQVPEYRVETTGSLRGATLLFVAFLTAFLIKFAQGSSTVSMITTSAMLAPLVGSPELIGYHPVYIACAIGFGAQCGNWMNDSGFWIFSKMSGLTEIETLKTWTVTVSTLAVIGLGFTLLFSKILPLL